MAYGARLESEFRSNPIEGSNPSPSATNKGVTMKITKYEHSCVVLEEDDQRLVIDPGVLSKLPATDKVVAVFVTHIHGDHLSPENIARIHNQNPDLVIFGSEEVLSELKESGAKKQVIRAGDKYDIAGFNIKVFGQDHAVIYQKVPCANTGLMVNDKFYYPGDSLVPPEASVEVLGVPTHAPWLKTAEAMEFIKAVKAKTVVPMHNGLLNDWGLDFTYGWLKVACEEVSSEMAALAPGETAEF